MLVFEAGGLISVFFLVFIAANSWQGLPRALLIFMYSKQNVAWMTVSTKEY